jgi:hypothetical protein
MTKNTNNSLSDINNEGGLGFNRLLSDNEITNSESNNEKIFKLENENIALRTKLAEADPMNAIMINNTIELNNKEIERITTKNTKISTFEKNGYPTSLFDRDAYIDYGRGIRNNKWEEYKKDKDGGFITNNKNSINKPVEYNDKSISTDEGLSLQNIIKWSEKYPALQLRGQDFSYCKLLGYYPNNRLVILRRFNGGVPDNLFDYFRTGSKIEFTQPLATMVTWLKPEDEIISMSFNENWEDNKGAGILETLKGIFTSKDEKKDKNINLETFSDVLTSLALNRTMNKKDDGTDFSYSSIGKPNLIKEAKKKSTGGGGLSSTIAFTLTFEYELRYIEKIDPSIAMLDLISNAMRMGTSESEFMYNISALTSDDYITNFINGDIEQATKMFVTGITDFTKDLSKSVNIIMDGLGDVMKKASTGEVKGNSSPKDILSKLLSDSIKFILSRYREDLKAAISADTGLPNGTWHVTIGNPKSPIVSCGDLIISKSELTLGKELGYDDFPNSFRVQYILGFARNRGRQELAKILNSGRGRTYVYPKAKDNPDFNIY